VPDPRLQQRAGLNIGIEPTLFPFVQAGSGREIPINPSGDTVIAEHTGQASRVALANANGISGWLTNTGGPAPGIDVDFLFVDALGNEISLTGGFPIPVGVDPGPVEIVLDNLVRTFCLAPGEKIIARAFSNPGDPLNIFGQEGLLGWWRADAKTLVAGKVSALADMSGHGLDASEAVGANRFGWISSGPANGQPAVMGDNPVGQLGLLGTFPLSAGARPGFFAVGSLTLPLPALPTVPSLFDSYLAAGPIFGVDSSVAYKAPPDVSYAVGALTDGFFFVSQNADADVHLWSITLEPTGGFWRRDALALPLGFSGGLLNASDSLSLGGCAAGPPFSLYAWNGFGYEWWVSAAPPTPSQLQRCLLYAAARYGISL
jgi:hypothetical protein